jgi:hypothetical protein
MSGHPTSAPSSSQPPGTQFPGTQFLGAQASGGFPASTAPTSTFAASGVPQQRASGTVYGGTGGYPEMTMPVQMSFLENSGSLTGHILAQGWSDTPQRRRRGNTKVVMIMVLVLLGLVGMSLLFLFTAGDAFTRLFQGLF